MKKLVLHVSLTISLMCLMTLTTSFADDFDRFDKRFKRDRTVHARLTGFSEVPSVISKGAGAFKARLSSDKQSIEYELNYVLGASDREVTQAHIHIGQSRVNGGVAVFLCKTTQDAPNAPVCVAQPGTVTGTITADDVLGIDSQGLNANDFEAVLKAIAADAAYINVHSTRFGPGELRGQVKHRRRFLHFD